MSHVIDKQLKLQKYVGMVGSKFEYINKSSRDKQRCYRPGVYKNGVGIFEIG